MNRLTLFCLAFCLMTALLMDVPCVSADVVFFTEFEYSDGEPIVDLDVDAINGADGQIGTFSGTLPDGAGNFDPYVMGFEENPDDFSRLLWVDRPIEHGSFFALLASDINADGATFSLDVGTRRTVGGAHDKDYDIIGMDSAGNESFHLRVATPNNIVDESKRLGVVTDDGASVIFDLPTVEGDDMDFDLENLGGLPWSEGVIGKITLTMGSGGYVIDFENFANAYKTETIPYNGSATSLSQIEFTFAGGDSGPLRSGYVLDNLSVEGSLATGAALKAGDANMDLEFNQLDLVQVQIAAKYLSGQAATWGEGDWDGAPGGSPGSPPAGDGQFNQLDIIAALGAGIYLTGPYGAISGGGLPGDDQTSVGYDAGTGQVWVDAPAGTDLTSINIDSASGVFTGDPAQNLGGSFDNDADGNIFKATFGSSFGSLSFGNVAQTGLSEDFVQNDLTVVGSLAGGGALGDVDLIYVPEPASFLLLAVGLAIGLLRRRGVSR